MDKNRPVSRHRGKQLLSFLSKQPQKTIIRVVITAGFVYAVNKNLSLSEIIDLLRNVSPLSLLGAFILGACSLLLQVLRWQVILESHTLPSNHHITMKTMFRGFLLAFVTPGRIGELFRAVSIDRKRHLASVVAVMEERSFAVVLTVGTGIICTILHGIYFQKSIFYPHLWVASIFLVIFFTICIIMRKSGNIIERHHFIARFAFFEAYFQRLRELPLTRLVLYSAGAHGMLLLQTSLVLSMFGAEDLVDNVIVAGQAFSFMVFIPLFIANIGLREYAFAFFLKYFIGSVHNGVTVNSIALGAATVILIMNIVIPALIGLIWLYMDKKKDQTAGVARSGVQRTDTGEQ
jgi:uncharacterized membrane protein YbhN (UPF0104 family)